MPFSSAVDFSDQAEFPVVLPDAPPRTVGPWQILHAVGEGTWCRVFQARPARPQPATCQTPFSADYVLKVLKSEHEGNVHAIAGLVREAQVGRRVSHPHLLPVFAGHLRSPPYYLVLPMIVGQTLRDLVQARALLSVPFALWLTRQTAEGLAALHHHGFAHGDVKPANILVAKTGHVTLFDLGFAQPLPERCATRPESPPIRLAATPAYAAPELFLDRPADGKSDCYSLGVLLFEMLTGQLPFTASDPVQLAAAHLQQSVPEPRQLAQRIPLRLARLIKQMLAKDPLRRPSLEELVAILVELEIDTFAER